MRLAADLGVDRMVLRPLNYSDTVSLTWDRHDYHFEYQNELLPFDELVRVSARAAHLCQALGVELADQMDFGGNLRPLFPEEAGAPDEAPSSGPNPPAIVPPVEAASSAPVPPVALSAPAIPAAATAPAAEEPRPSLGGGSAPACLEPWKSLYILRRGVLPCCYGSEPVAPMEGYREAWNSPLLQDIRGQLLQGRFHEYCLRSPACPIVRQAGERARPAGVAGVQAARPEGLDAWIA